MASANVLILCNVGSRDVMIEDRVPSPAREEGLRLLREYDTVASRLTFPIMEPSLRYILDRHPGASGHLLLLGTDQPDPAYRSTDTLHFAELAARRLPEVFPGLRVEWRPIQGINPALYDEAFEWFGPLLSSLSGEEKVEACYAIIAGGTPACNMALLLQGVRYFGDRLRAIYLPWKGEPHELRAGQQIINTFREAAAIEHLERLDFANAFPQLERLGAHPGLRGLVRYAAARLAFDFRSAQEALEQALRDGDHPTRDFCQRLRHDLDALRTGAGPERLKALLRELYWNTLITWDHRRYADFLGRVYRFQEAILRYLVEAFFGLSTDLSPAVREENQRRWNETIAANPHLLEYLQSRELDGQPLDWQSIARPTYKALLSYATDEALGQDAEGKPLIPPADRGRYAALVREVNRLDSLVELRHRTIIGHDFEGVSEEQVRQKYPDPPGGLKKIMEMLGMNVKENPYREIAEFVIRRLRER